MPQQLLDKSRSNRKPVPRHMQLTATLREAILAGEYEKSFPTEGELCRIHGLSRFTVREALRRLQSEGLISRRRGSGTIVQPATARDGALRQPLSNVDEILQYARDTSIIYDKPEQVKLPRKVLDQIDGDVRGQWLKYSGIRQAASDPLPIGFTEAYVIEALAGAMEGFDPSSSTIFRHLEDREGVVVQRVTQDIQAIAAPIPVAQKLGIPRRAACLRILRCYYDRSGRLFELAVNYHPGNRFAYTMHIDVDN